MDMIAYFDRKVSNNAEDVVENSVARIRAKWINQSRYVSTSCWHLTFKFEIKSVEEVQINVQTLKSVCKFNAKVEMFGKKQNKSIG